MSVESSPPIIYIFMGMAHTIISATNSKAERLGTGATRTHMKLNRRICYETHEKASESLALLLPGDDVRTVLRRRGHDSGHCEVIGMEGFENLVSMLDYVLDTKRKRHITGGILLSISLLFGGLAITVMSINESEEEDSNEEAY